MRRTLIIALFGLILISLVEWRVDNEIKHYQLNQNANKNQKALFLGPVSLVIRDVWHLIHENEKELLVVFTALLFIITAYLVKYTRGLLIEARNQFPHFKDNVQAATKAADAATVAAEAASKQAKAAVNVERPFVYASGLDLIRFHADRPDGTETYKIVVTYTNYGRTPAFVMRIGHGDAIALEKDIPPAPTYHYGVWDNTSGLVIKPGEKFEFSPLHLFSTTPDNRAAIEKNEAYPYVWGQVVYTDFFNGLAEVGFIAFQYPEVRVGDKIIQVAAFRLRGPPAYSYQRYSEDKAADEEAPA